MRHGIIPLDEANSPLTKNTDRTDITSAQRGQLLYEKHCLQCHGKTGIGDGMAGQDLEMAPTNLREVIKDVKNFDFFMSVSNWKGSMPGWTHPFSSQQRKDLANYIKTFRD